MQVLTYSLLQRSTFCSMVFIFKRFREFVVVRLSYRLEALRFFLTFTMWPDLDVDPFWSVCKEFWDFIKANILVSFMNTRLKNCGLRTILTWTSKHFGVRVEQTITIECKCWTSLGDLASGHYRQFHLSVIGDQIMVTCQRHNSNNALEWNRYLSHNSLDHGRWC